MNIHEYQGKALLKEFGVPTLEGRVATTVEEATAVLTHFNLTKGVVVKAQIHAGGRGKAGGVKIAKDKQSFDAAVSSILGATLVTAQTTKDGQKVRTLYIEDTCAIKREYYLSLALDRKNKRFVVIASSEGGVNIEEVAEKSPEKVLYLGIDPVVGYQPFHGRRLVTFLDVPKESQVELMNLLQGLYKAFITLDAELIEINPLVLTHDHTWLALDAKMTFDDNGLPRQKRVSFLFDENEVDPAELRAKEFDLTYIKLDGTIGCMVNGAGLAMSTMDIITQHGAEPANFLDVGGGATKEKVTEAFKIIVDDKDVKAIFVNIFGGIMRCDVIAEGIIAAAKEINLKVPLVVRLQGTNVEQGRALLNQSGLKIIAEDDFEKAAATVVNVAKGH
ncbi:MAG: ADP-forming succinate--CoA ligase subunit beta [Alphaproteobacteria bacterium]|nr:ADP-forming succinate--CoA ligase subunit beta [Alphaproteobacteria bacterium]